MFVLEPDALQEDAFCRDLLQCTRDLGSILCGISWISNCSCPDAHGGSLIELWIGSRAGFAGLLVVLFSTQDLGRLILWRISWFCVLVLLWRCSVRIADWNLLVDQRASTVPDSMPINPSGCISCGMIKIRGVDPCGNLQFFVRV